MRDKLASDQLASDQSARLASKRLNYAEVGATGIALPDDADHLGADVVIGHGIVAFEAASEALMTWQMHRCAGARVRASAPRVAVGVNALIGFGPEPLHLPCRVLHVVEQPDRVGFTYGTVAGHLFAGEESFSVVLDADERVHLVVIGFTRPANGLARLINPVLKRVSRRMIRRYAAALKTAISASS
jgi:uncharacterized protein (UPF0548 family)